MPAQARTSDNIVNARKPRSGNAVRRVLRAGVRRAEEPREKDSVRDAPNTNTLASRYADFPRRVCNIDVGAHFRPRIRYSAGTASDRRMKGTERKRAKRSAQHGKFGGIVYPFNRGQEIDFTSVVICRLLICHSTFWFIGAIFIQKGKMAQTSASK